MSNDRALGNTTSPKGQLREQFFSSLHSMKYREKSTFLLNFNKGHRTRELLCQKAKSLYRRVAKCLLQVSPEEDSYCQSYKILSKSKFELGGFCFIRSSVNNYMVFSERL